MSRLLACRRTHGSTPTVPDSCGLRLGVEPFLAVLVGKAQAELLPSVSLPSQLWVAVAVPWPTQLQGLRCGAVVQTELASGFFPVLTGRLGHTLVPAGHVLTQLLPPNQCQNCHPGVLPGFLCGPLGLMTPSSPVVHPSALPVCLRSAVANPTPTLPHYPHKLLPAPQQAVSEIAAFGLGKQ